MEKYKYTDFNIFMISFEENRAVLTFSYRNSFDLSLSLLALTNDDFNSSSLLLYTWMKIGNSADRILKSTT